MARTRSTRRESPASGTARPSHRHEAACCAASARTTAACRPTRDGWQSLRQEPAWSCSCHSRCWSAWRSQLVPIRAEIAHARPTSRRALGRFGTAAPWRSVPAAPRPRSAASCRCCPRCGSALAPWRQCRSRRRYMLAPCRDGSLHRFYARGAGEMAAIAVE